MTEWRHGRVPGAYPGRVLFVVAAVEYGGYQGDCQHDAEHADERGRYGIDVHLVMGTRLGSCHVDVS